MERWHGSLISDTISGEIAHFWKILFFCLVSSTLLAQDPYHINYSIADGLPSSEVYDLEIDSLQRLWISTDRGVCVYDGYTFKTYTTKDGLADNTNFEIYKDPKGRFWFNGYNKKLSYYEDGKFHPYEFNDSLVSTISQFSRGWVHNIISFDEEDYYFNAVKSRRCVVYQFNKNKAPNLVFVGEERKLIDDLVYLESDISPAKKVGASFHYTSSSLAIEASFALETDQFWIYRKDVRLFKKNKQTRKTEVYRSESPIEFMYIDHQDNLWICTRKGILCFEQLDFTLPPKHFFKDFTISSILQDFEGNYWISSNEAGIFLVPSFDIQVIEGANEKENFLSIGQLKNHLVIGTSNTRLFIVNKNARKQIIQLQNIREKTQIRHLEKRKVPNQLDFGGNHFITEIEGQVQLVKDSENKPSLEYDRLQISNLLSNGDLFSYVGIGFRITRENEAYVRSSELERPLTKTTTVIVQTSQEKILLGTLNGLYKIEDYDYDNYEELFVSYPDRPFRRINDIKVDDKDNIWIATIGEGMYLMTADTTYHLTTSDGLVSDMVNQLLITNDTTVWIATNKGINQLNYEIEAGQFDFLPPKLLSINDGLNSNYVNDIELWNGELWVATNDGICSFPTNILDKEFPEVPIFINKFLVNDSVYTVEEDLSLTYDQNDIFIEFTGVSFRKRNDNAFYRYRLIEANTNNDAKWFETNDKAIRYNNLSAGNYRFEVAAQNKLGQWNKMPALVSFSIEPHYSQTIWFKLLLFALVTSIVAAIIYILINNHQRKQKLKETLLKVQAAELASLRNQMNPHFVFNSLNSIQNFVFKKDVKKASYYLSKFSDLMRNSLQYTRLDFITLEQEISFLKDYLELEMMRFPNKFEVEFDLDEDLDVKDISVPSLLLQPILENSVKHAFKGIKQKGWIKIKISKNQEECLQVQLLDNGVGIKEKVKPEEQNNEHHRSFGMKILRDRIELLNNSVFEGKAYVEYTNYFLGDKGLKVLLNLPITYNT
ncbi:MAG: histidine kinase [Bacteroidota bacterium]